FAPDVAELERRLVVSRVLVVDEPHLPAHVDEVLGEEIVVARHRLLRADAHRALELADLRLELLVAVGETKATLADDREVAGLELEHVEVVQEAAPGMQSAAGGGNSGDAVSAAQLRGVHHLALAIAEDQRVV